MSGYRFERLKVLIVDDNQHARYLVAQILRAFGVASLCEAESAEQAWPLLREFHPDIVIVDWMMDGMSGIELSKMIRTSDTSPNPFVPIIMLTSYTSIDHVREARDAGVNEFLAKPISVNAMLRRLLSIIEHPRPFVRTKAYFGPCRRRRDNNEYQGPERRTLSTDSNDAAASPVASAA